MYRVYSMFQPNLWMHIITFIILCSPDNMMIYIMVYYSCATTAYPVHSCLCIVRARLLSRRVDSFNTLGMECQRFFCLINLKLGARSLISIQQIASFHYMNVLDGLLLAVLGLLVLLLITFLQNSRGIKALPLILVIICGFPQFVFLLIVTYRKLKGKWISRYIAGKVSTLVKQNLICKQNQADELSDADQLPHRLVNPSQYNKTLLSVSEQADDNSETLAIRGRFPPVYTYGSIS